jgi:hypothetical protein
MILRDGRRQVHDLGPRHTFRPSLMEFVGYTGSTGSGGWDRSIRACKRQMSLERPVPTPMMKVASVSSPLPKSATTPRARRPAEEKRAWDRAYSAAHRERRRQQLNAWRARCRIAA